ncbi:MAG: penicillin-binding protein 2 [Candidatus Pacebacteria bacterium]|nr:penicillin-binding protein 2 [Candidatus Paceibacterota bacterium]
MSGFLNSFRKRKKYESKEVSTEDFFLDFLAKKKDSEREYGKNKKEYMSGGGAIETALTKKNFFIIFSIFSISIIFLAGTCLYYQFFNYDYYFKKAQSNKYVYSEIDAQRGVIYDREMKQIVFNSNSFDLIFKKNTNIDEYEIDREIWELSKILEKSVDEIKSSISEKQEKFKDKNEFAIFNDLNKDKIIVLKTKADDFKVFSIRKNQERQYSDPYAFSHVLGYFSKESDDGGWGIEKEYNEYLKEIPGIFTKERDAKGEVISEKLVRPLESGKNLVLNLDLGTQKKVNDSIREIVEKYHAKSATVVMSDVKTGGIIAMGTWPSFDANILSKGLTHEEYQAMVKSNDFSFYNRAIAGEYAIGSTIKPVMAAAGLEEELITPNEIINCQGRIALPGGGYKNDWTVHGMTDLKKAMAESCDVYFYILGGGYNGQKGLGIEKMNQYFKEFGYGNLTGIDISGEKAGFVPDPDWKKKKYNTSWYPGDNYNIAIGQGYFKGTPLQINMATAAIANGGKLMKPKIVKKVLSSDEKEIKTFNPEITRTVNISSENLAEVRTAMRETVMSPNGTARGLQLMPVTSAAKTGTAQTSEANKYHNLITIFAPYENPEVAITVVVESVPYEMNAANILSREIMNYYFGERLKKDEEKNSSIESQNIQSEETNINSENPIPENQPLIKPGELDGEGIREE